MVNKFAYILFVSHSHLWLWRSTKSSILPTSTPSNNCCSTGLCTVYCSHCWRISNAMYMLSMWKTNCYSNWEKCRSFSLAYLSRPVLYWFLALLSHPFLRWCLQS